MGPRPRWILALLVAILCPLLAWAQVKRFDSDVAPSDLTPGQQAIRAAIGAPARVDLLDQATLRMSGDLMFVPRTESANLLRATHHPVATDLVGLVLDANGTDWFGILHFVDDGFVPAQTVTEWSADDLLESLRTDGAGEANAQNEQEVRGWLQAPVYDAQKHSLTWATRFAPKDAPDTVSGQALYHAVLFGRNGYFQLDIDTAVDHLERQREDAAAVLRDMTFLPGHAYSEFNPATDRVAPRGLSAVFGVKAIHAHGWYRGILSNDLLIPGACGVVLILGAGLLVVIQFRIARARNQRG
jgi:uncharacterized membrane-anchored protein